MVVESASMESTRRIKMVMVLLKFPSMIHPSIMKLFKLMKICKSTGSNLMLLKRNGVKKRYIYCNLLI